MFIYKYLQNLSIFSQFLMYVLSFRIVVTGDPSLIPSLHLIKKKLIFCVCVWALGLCLIKLMCLIRKEGTDTYQFLIHVDVVDLSLTSNVPGPGVYVDSVRRGPGTGVRGLTTLQDYTRDHGFHTTTRPQILVSEEKERDQRWVIPEII